MNGRLKFDVAVGLVFFLAMGILGYYTVIMSHEIFEPDDIYNINVVFKNSGGLAVKDKVLVNGVHSGSVSDISLKASYVLVTLKMFNDFPLYENYVIKIYSEAALGGKQVRLIPGASSDDEGMFYTKIAKSETLYGTLDDPITSITSLIEENRENIYVSIKNLREFTEKINTGKGTIAQLINEDKVITQTDILLKELREVVEDAREQAPVTSFIRAALMAF